MVKSIARYKQLKPDPRYHSLTVAKFVNYLMSNGKKDKVRAIVYRSFDIIKKRTKKEPLSVFEKALKNVSPFVEVKSKRIGGATYQVPVEVNKKRKVSLAMRWIIEAAKKRKGMAMEERLARELVEAYKNEGSAVKKKEDTHRMAEANKAFAHYARF